MSALTVDATAVWPSGRTQPGRAKVCKVQSAPDAIAALEHGALCVYVARADVDAVRAWTRERAVILGGESLGDGQSVRE